MTTATKSVGTETFSLLRFLDAITPNASPEDQKRGGAEVMASAVAKKLGGVDVASRPGMPLPLSRDMVTSSPAAGGNLIGSPVGSIEAAARPLLTLEKLGAQRLTAPTTSDFEISVWRNPITDWEALWLPESGPTAELQPLELRSISVRAKQVGSHVVFSRRLVKQTGGGIESWILSELQAATSTGIERGCIQGKGGDQPLGLLQVPGTGSQSMAGALPTLAELAGMVATAGAANADLNRAGFLVSTADFAAMLRTQSVAANDDMLVKWEDGMFRCMGFPVMASAHMPAGKVAFGDWSKCRIIFFADPQVIIDRTTGINGVEGRTKMVLLNYLDFVVTEPSHLVIASA